ncbi:hypothetical protein A1342_09885 [Methylomonas methanica]|uniref:Uncharacterized protein n=1 Tax=Methylomonas denitrificans TaxID=1538553 RepID=A0A126T912_9GAMM|nr:hypothetical protein JT25_019110 [Methylomonas denitrificans]OAH98892.1 hypothetical protein A1342_09885 [Methylomonas methanica]
MWANTQSFNIVILTYIKALINPDLKLPVAAISAKMKIQCGNWTPACAGATIFKSWVNMCQLISLSLYFFGFRV